MKNSRFCLRLSAFILALATCLSLAACTSGDVTETSAAPDTTLPEVTDAPPAEAEMIDLIADGKLL